MFNPIKYLSTFFQEEYSPHLEQMNAEQLKLINKDLFSSIFNNTSEGLIIKEFLSAKELAIFKANFKTVIKINPELVDEKYIYEDLVGFTFGKTVIDCSDLKVYKKNATVFNQLESNLYSFSFNDRIMNILSQISLNTPISIFTFKDGAEAMAHSIRNFSKKARGIFNHADQITHKKKPHLKELMDSLDDRTILSFFVVIQKPEKGGNLKLYNDFYHNLPNHLVKEFDSNYKKIESYVNSLPSGIINLNEGDLIIFDAGQQWHQVEPIGGDADRITAGGFCGYSKDRKSIYIWS